MDWQISLKNFTAIQLIVYTEYVWNVTHIGQSVLDIYGLKAGVFGVRKEALQ